MTFIRKYILLCLPHHLLTLLVASFMKASMSKHAIKAYVKWYKIDLESLDQPINQYENLNQFFTRKLKPDARLIDPHGDKVISPVDGLVQQVGQIEDGTLVQAKGVNYTVEQLLADDEKADFFKNGTFMTIYLSPSDYHRVHAPIEGTITGYSYIPGRLYPVNQIGIHSINGIYTKNERLTTYLNTEQGKLAIVKVGALIVGSVQTSYEKQVEKIHKGRALKETFSSPTFLKKGDEIGHFEFGSTVILLFEENHLDLKLFTKPGQSIKMGEAIGIKHSHLKQNIN